MFKQRLEEILHRDTLGNRAWKLAWEIGLPTKQTERYQKHDLEQLFAKDRLPDCGNVSTKYPLPSGVIELGLSEAKVSYAVFFQNLWTKTSQSEKKIFPLLVEACSQEGKFFSVNKPVHETIWLDDVCVVKHSITLRWILIYVAKGASANFVIDRRLFPEVSETTLIDVVVEEGGSLQLIELDLNGENSAVSLSHVRAQVKRNGVFRHYSANRGGALVRSDFKIDLVGEGSEVDLQGIWSLDQKRVSHTEVCVVHKAPFTKSNQHFKGVLKGKSRSTFEGKIYVESTAQKTEAYQLNNNLILDQGANAFSKPNLEIFADDVKASHGATITRLSEEELFYLRTRGIQEKESKELLTQGFTKSIVSQFFCEEAKEKVFGL